MTCSKCGLDKPETEFYKTSGRRCKQCHNVDCSKRNKRNPEKNRVSSRKWYYAHREEAIAKVRQWQKANRQRDSVLQHKNSLLRNYQMHYEDYCNAVDQQGGKCAVCGTSPKRRLAVDHDHKCCPQVPTCGRCTRGLICSNCNTTVGLVKEDISVLHKLIAYLEEHDKSKAA